jgi:hypothetical protein
LFYVIWLLNQGELFGPNWFMAGEGGDVLILFGAQVPGFICFGLFADVGALRLEQASEWS